MSLKFENVMILNAPYWSPAGVQFTHGFLRWLVQAPQGEFLPGNVIATAQASNMSLCRMADCDIVSLVSQISIANSGMSCRWLLNLSKHCPENFMSEKSSNTNALNTSLKDLQQILCIVVV